MATSDKFKNIQPGEPDEIFTLFKRANEVEGEKANLVVGAYRDAEGYPCPLQCVRKAEKRVHELNMDYEYLHCSGYKPFTDAALDLLYGDTVNRNHIAAIQTISGTGALSVAAFFLTRVFDANAMSIYVANPTWSNHYGILQTAGWNVVEYAYYDPETKSLDFEGYKRDILDAPTRSIFLVQLCAQNPTGVDPSREQWEELVDIFQQKDHLLIMDCAYLGWATGSIEEDLYPIQLLVERKIQFLAAQSFSKNMGLYNARVGALSVVLHNSTSRDSVQQFLEAEALHLYTSPPAHGARIAHLVLTDNTLRKEWMDELRSMAERIHEIRHLVYDELQRLGTPGNWEHIVNQIGMFSFLGLPKEQCQYCIDHNVFICTNGRANMGALTAEKVPFFVGVIDASFGNK